MKKLLFLALALLVVLSGCGKKTEAPGNEATESSVPQETAQSGVSPEQEVTQSVEPKVDEPIITEQTPVGDYTTSFIAKFVENGTYYISQNVTENGETKKSEVAASGNKVAERGEEGTKIIDGETLYYVIPDKKAILTSPVAMSMKDGITNFIIEKTASGAKSKLVTTGKETVNGEELSFEQFKDDKNTVTKYYYDSKTIRYIRVTTSEGAETFTQVLALSHTVPDGFFDVPDGYVVQDLSKVQ